MSLLRTPPSKLAYPVTTFDDALDALYPEPLDFALYPHVAASLYKEHEARIDPSTGIVVTSPSKSLSRRFLKSTASQKAFLSGHVGGGKSTELRQLASMKKITGAFFPILAEIEPGYWDTLDVAQLLYLMSCAVFEYANNQGLLANRDVWKQPLKALEESFFGASGLRATAGTVGLDVDLVFVRLKQELKFEEQRRLQFHELGKTRMFVLAQLLAGLIADMQQTAFSRGDVREPLLLIDGLDKVRKPEVQERTFREKPSVLFEPPVRIVYTIPVGVAFNYCPKIIRDSLVHLYPAPTLKKASGCYDPEQVANEIGLDFLRKVLDSRVAPGIFEPEAVRMAGTYSGGAIRNFFWLLRSSIDIADGNDMRVVDARVMRTAIKEARLSESQSLHKEEYEKLAEVHRTNFLPHRDAAYLDQSWAYGYANDRTWYDVNPLLWRALAPN